VCVASLNISRRNDIVYVQTGISDLVQLVKIFVFYQTPVLIMVISIFYIDQTTVIPRCHERIFLNIHFNIILNPLSVNVGNMVSPE